MNSNVDVFSSNAQTTYIGTVIDVKRKEGEDVVDKLGNKLNPFEILFSVGNHITKARALPLAIYNEVNIGDVVLIYSLDSLYNNSFIYAPLRMVASPNDTVNLRYNNAVIDFIPSRGGEETDVQIAAGDNIVTINSTKGTIELKSTDGVKINGGGDVIDIRNDKFTLHKLIDNLIDEITGLKITVPNGIGTVAPVSTTKLLELSDKFMDLLGSVDSSPHDTNVPFNTMKMEYWEEIVKETGPEIFGDEETYEKGTDPVIDKLVEQSKEIIKAEKKEEIRKLVSDTPPPPPPLKDIEEIKLELIESGKTQAEIDAMTEEQLREAYDELEETVDINDARDYLVVNGIPRETVDEMTVEEVEEAYNNIRDQEATEDAENTEETITYEEARAILVEYGYDDDVVNGLSNEDVREALRAQGVDNDEILVKTDEELREMLLSKGITREVIYGMTNEAVSGAYAEIKFDEEERKEAATVPVPKVVAPESTVVNNKEGIKPSVQRYVDDRTKLSSKFTVADLSTGLRSKIAVRGQFGFTKEEIVANMAALAVNILDPLSDYFKSMGKKINFTSGFRTRDTLPSGEVSQHQKGMAVDIQIAGLRPAQYLPIAYWIRDNLPFDQLIFEHSSITRNIWLHVSYDRLKKRQRKDLRHMIKGKVKPGLKLYY